VKSVLIHKQLETIYFNNERRRFLRAYRLNTGFFGLSGFEAGFLGLVGFWGLTGLITGFFGLSGLEAGFLGLTGLAS